MTREEDTSLELNMKNILRSIATTVTVLLAFTVVPAASAATHELGELVLSCHNHRNSRRSMVSYKTTTEHP